MATITYLSKACMLALAIFTLVPVAAFAQQSGEVRVTLPTDWRQRIADCFDSCGNENSALLSRLAREAEASRDQRLGPFALQTAAPDSVLVDAYLQQGRLEEARVLLLGPRFLVNSNGQASLLPSTREYVEWRTYALAAIALGQRHYSDAASLYLTWVAYRLRSVALQPIFLGAMVLVSWKFKPGEKPLVSLREYLVVIVISCIPIWVLLISAVLGPMNSLILFGSAGRFMTNHRCWFIGTGMYHIELLAILLAAAIHINRRISVPDPDLLTGGKEERMDLPTNGSISRRFRLGALLCLIIAGTILAGGQRFGPAYAFWPRQHVHLADIWWWVTFLGTIMFAPICEEAFFRGTLYSIARRTMDPLFGAALSAIAFAGYHVDAARFPSLVWTGIALAMLFEIKKSIWLPATAHVLYNLFSSW